MRTAREELNTTQHSTGRVTHGLRTAREEGGVAPKALLPAALFRCSSAATTF